LRDAAGCVLCAVAIMMAFFARVLVLGDTADGGSRVQKRTVLEFTETRKISNKLNGAAEQMHSKCKANAEQMHTQSQSQLQHDDDDARREVSHGTPRIATPTPSIGSPLLSDTAFELVNEIARLCRGDSFLPPS
jgi:hypothetical protein